MYAYTNQQYVPVICMRNLLSANASAVANLTEEAKQWSMSYRGGEQDGCTKYHVGEMNGEEDPKTQGDTKEYEIWLETLPDYTSGAGERKVTTGTRLKQKQLTCGVYVCYTALASRPSVSASGISINGNATLLHPHKAAVTRCVKAHTFSSDLVGEISVTGGLWEVKYRASKIIGQSRQMDDSASCTTGKPWSVATTPYFHKISRKPSTLGGDSGSGREVQSE
ncbi:hypothetical protein FISHEDRAFT_60108 [Fistulina hepatica ATCC 64428]|uniref:Uncharacterized protein n=1 Tax=Fistulina hepatica ATCC 64428 TaxID=1128425 RepID=A0A0D7A6Z3_9AGAR|nr:hypothetical protein FISHEDRAFT_60108 [Fistulina hepatica ATCC 64428]